MSIHDLEEINAVLRLGDRFVPPNGTVCVFCTKHFDIYRRLWFRGKVERKRFIERTVAGLPVRKPGPNVHVSFVSIERSVPSGPHTNLVPGKEIILSVFEIWTVVEVPVEAPVFSEWDRL